MLNEFDANRFFLGQICIRKHEWNNTGKSLRRIRDGRMGECVECKGIKDINYHAPESAKKRFVENITIDTQSNCWIWNGNKTIHGYGIAKIKGQRMMAHRASWIYHYGQIPKGLCVCHKCDIRLCVNPGHLFLGTHQDNMDDKVRKGRQSRQIGENHGRSKLKAGDILDIKELAKYEEVDSIAAKFNIHPQSVRRILRGDSWKHLTQLADAAASSSVK